MTECGNRRTVTYVRIYYTGGFAVWTSTFLMKATVHDMNCRVIIISLVWYFPKKKHSLSAYGDNATSRRNCKDWFDLYLTYRNTGKAAKLFGVPRLMEIDFFVFCDILQLSKECDDILLTILISEVQVWKELKP